MWWLFVGGIRLSPIERRQLFEAQCKYRYTLLYCPLFWTRFSWPEFVRMNGYQIEATYCLPSTLNNQINVQNNWFIFRYWCGSSKPITYSFVHNKLVQWADIDFSDSIYIDIKFNYHFKNRQNVQYYRFNNKFWIILSCLNFMQDYPLTQW